MRKLLPGVIEIVGVGIKVSNIKYVKNLYPRMRIALFYRSLLKDLFKIRKKIENEKEIKLIDETIKLVNVLKGIMYRCSDVKNLVSNLSTIYQDIKKDKKLFVYCHICQKYLADGPKIDHTILNKVKGSSDLLTKYEENKVVLEADVEKILGGPDIKCKLCFNEEKPTELIIPKEILMQQEYFKVMFTREWLEESGKGIEFSDFKAGSVNTLLQLIIKDFDPVLFHDIDIELDRAEPFALIYMVSLYYLRPQVRDYLILLALDLLYGKELESNSKYYEHEIWAQNKIEIDLNEKVSSKIKKINNLIYFFLKMDGFQVEELKNRYKPLKKTNLERKRVFVPLYLQEYNPSQGTNDFVSVKKKLEYKMQFKFQQHIKKLKELKLLFEQSKPENIENKILQLNERIKPESLKEELDCYPFGLSEFIVFTKDIPLEMVIFDRYFNSGVEFKKLFSKLLALLPTKQFNIDLKPLKNLSENDFSIFYDYVKAYFHFNRDIDDFRISGNFIRSIEMPRAWKIDALGMLLLQSEFCEFEQKPKDYNNKNGSLRKAFLELIDRLEKDKSLNFRSFNFSNLKLNTNDLKVVADKLKNVQNVEKVHLGFSAKISCGIDETAELPKDLYLYHGTQITVNSLEIISGNILNSGGLSQTEKSAWSLAINELIKILSKSDTKLVLFWNSEKKH
ncbi:hypothetical protein ACFLZV_05005 [Candidatus Margulisiibacteriota bacterium]